VLNGAATLTDTLFLNAQENPDAIFIIKIYGALNTAANSQVKLINGALAQNVYWMVNGAVDIADFSTFNGTIISQGAINLFTGVNINGRALAGAGAIGTSAIISNADIDPSCNNTNIELEKDKNPIISIYPNPFNDFINIEIEDASQNNIHEMRIFNNIGQEIIYTSIIQKSQTIDLQNLPAGIYSYRLSDSNSLIKTGRIVSL
jgi:hypothetical protein